jgi:glycerophosphoryl diester phosphodiesterase
MINIDTVRVKFPRKREDQFELRIYAHRGISARHPENTLEAFQAALDANVFGVELDIHCSSDGVPVVLHDDSLERTTNGTGSVIQHSVAELRALDAGNGQHVPTFDEVVALAAGRLHFDIEIKVKNCEQGVLEVLARYPSTRAAVSSFDWDVLATVRSLDSSFELWVLTPTISDEAIETAGKLAATTLAVHHLGISRSAMDRASSAGLEVMAWTVNNQKEADRLRNLGVSAICTDDSIEIH